MRWRRWLLPCVAAATLLLQAVLHTRAIGSTLSMAGGDGSRQQRSQPRRDWESATARRKQVPPAAAVRPRRRLLVEELSP